MASPEQATRRRPWMVVATAAFVLVLVIAAFLVGRSTDDEDGSTPATTTTEPSTATSPTTPTTSLPTSTTTTSTTSPVVVDTATAVWPPADSDIRYRDPVEAARGFAVDLVGFDDPVVGEFRAGDSRSGEVEVRARSTGPATTVFVRQLSGSDDWWVLGAATGNIEITEPAALDAITSPVALAGRSTAFESVVSVRLYADGSTDPIATGTVMGGSMGEVLPFSGSLDFPRPAATHGALVLLTESMEDGSVWEAAVLRVAFG